MYRGGNPKLMRMAAYSGCTAPVRVRMMSGGSIHASRLGGRSVARMTERGVAFVEDEVAEEDEAVGAQCVLGEGDTGVFAGLAGVVIVVNVAAGRHRSAAGTAAFRCSVVLAWAAPRWLAEALAFRSV
jgi:hypothetical protein